MEKKGIAQAGIFGVAIILIVAVVIGAFLLINSSSEPDEAGSRDLSSSDNSIKESQEQEELDIKIPPEPKIQQPIPEPDPQIKEIDVIAKRWEFSPNPIRVRKGDTVILNIESIDVAHGFGLPDFGISERLNPGKTVRIEFIADKRGVFRLFCNVQCGSGHGSMFGQLIVE